MDAVSLSEQEWRSECAGCQCVRNHGFSWFLRVSGFAFLVALRKGEGGLLMSVRLVLGGDLGWWALREEEPVPMKFGGESRP